MNSRTLISVAAAIVALGGFTTAWRAYTASTIAVEEVDRLQRERARLLAERDQVQRQLSPPRHAPTTAEPRPVAAPQPTAPQPARPRHTTDPELQARAVASFHSQLGVRYAAFYHALGWTLAQQTAFEALLTEHEARRRDILAAERVLPESTATATREATTMDGRRVTVTTDAAIARLLREEDAQYAAAREAALGSEVNARLVDFEQGTDSRAFVAEFAAQRSLTSGALTAVRAVQLAEAVQRAGYAPGARPPWDAIRGAAVGVLDPHQLAEWETMIRARSSELQPDELSQLVRRWQRRG